MSLAQRLEHGYRIDEDASSEVEFREFLRGLIRITKPQLVVETGCYVGRGTRAIAEALRENGRGRVVSCDVEWDHVVVAHRELGKTFGFSPGSIVEINLCRGVDLQELKQADLVFLDSGYRERRAEFDLVKPGALVVVHDTRISFDSEIPPHETWVRPLGGILFETYRGFALIRKAA